MTSFLTSLTFLYKGRKTKSREYDEEFSFVSKPVLKYLDKMIENYYVVIEKV
jgi:hypothetical protein